MEIQCPQCGKKQEQKALKTWKYLRTVTASQYKCSNCRKRFRFYVSPKSTWTIPKGKKPSDEWKKRHGER